MCRELPNAPALADRTTGEILLRCQEISGGLANLLENEWHGRCPIASSTNDGQTWSSSQEITDSVRHFRGRAGFATPQLPDGQQRLNEFVGQQTAFGPAFRGEFLVRPDDDPEWVQEVRRLGLHGLKCYHTFAGVTPTWEAEIPAFLPESLFKVAHEEGWVIALHMVRPG